MPGDEPLWSKQQQGRRSAVIEIVMPVVKDGIQQPVRNVVREFPGVRKREKLRPRFHVHIEMSVEESARERVVITIEMVAPDEPVSGGVCLPYVIYCDDADDQRPGYAIFTREFCQIPARAEVDRQMRRSGVSLPWP